MGLLTKVGKGNPENSDNFITPLYSMLIRDRGFLPQTYEKV